MITYDNSSTMIVNKTPTVSFDDRVSRWFINEFLALMSRGQITVKDYQGNELKVKAYE
jgi:hypothetical protein